MFLNLLLLLCKIGFQKNSVMKLDDFCRFMYQQIGTDRSVWMTIIDILHDAEKRQQQRLPGEYFNTVRLHVCSNHQTYKYCHARMTYTLIQKTIVQIHTETQKELSPIFLIRLFFFLHTTMKRKKK